MSIVHNRAIVSFFDQFPDFEGVQIEIRGTDGYFEASSMQKAMKQIDGKMRRFNDWTKTKFAQRLLQRLSEKTGIPVSWERSRGCADLRTPSQTPLIDYDRASGGKVMLHPYVAMSYAGSVPEFQAEMNIWLVDLMTLGTVNPHYLKWTMEEYQRGLEMNRDDIQDLYG